ncbi:uncharacterized protein LOC129768688 [Toxorhynchites rutilus septentrionalis]|uniref:uncharacterized protein LOC129768688 n=1 Tax=Toxorhynchites rutilus septentrionalis TaxID=329112 RepID=UPI002479DB47|nr:uncharacterized protein LOC129768688 [Toxorhynchites rutilus septentrionalis]
MDQLAKLERKKANRIKKHKKRIATFNLSLPCYAAEIRKLDPIALDNNMLAYLETLINMLTKMVQKEKIQYPWNDEIDFHDRNVSFAIGCNYCKKPDTSAFGFMVHIMDTNQHNSVDKRMKKLRTVRDTLMTNYATFLNEEREILQRNGFDRPVLENMLNFYFITQLFVQVTARYKKSLNYLGCSPSTIVARGALDLLKELGDLISRAKCVESKPNIDKILMNRGHKLFYQIEDMTFSSAGGALTYAETNFEKCHRGNSPPLS